MYIFNKGTKNKRNASFKECPNLLQRKTSGNPNLCEGHNYFTVSLTSLKLNSVLVVRCINKSNFVDFESEFLGNCTRWTFFYRELINTRSS